MTLTLHLSPELEKRLLQEAGRLGLAPADYALRVLDRHLAPKDRRAEAVALLQSWIDDPDPEDLKQTGEYLLRALDEDRLSDRPLFPPDQEGVMW